MRWCLKDAGIALSDVSQVAVNQDARANFWRKLAFVAASRPDLSLVLDRIRNKREREGVAEWFETDDDVPFMMQVYQVRPGKRALIPAVTHVERKG